MQKHRMARATFRIAVRVLRQPSSGSLDDQVLAVVSNELTVPEVDQLGAKGLVWNQLSCSACRHDARDSH